MNKSWHGEVHRSPLTVSAAARGLCVCRPLNQCDCQTAHVSLSLMKKTSLSQPHLSTTHSIKSFHSVKTSLDPHSTLFSFLKSIYNVIGLGNKFNIWNIILIYFILSFWPSAVIIYKKKKKMKRKLLKWFSVAEVKLK